MTTVRWSRACAAGLETAVSLLSVHLDEVKEHLLLEDMCLPDIRFYIQLDTRSILDGWSVWTVLAPPLWTQRLHGGQFSKGSQENAAFNEAEFLFCLSP